MYAGAQLFTVRKYTQTPEDLRNTFKKIAEIGYKYAQVSAIGPIEAEELRDISIESGVKICNTHSNQERILNDTDALIAEHKIYNCSQIYIGSMPGRYQGSIEGVKQFIADYRPAAQKIMDNGMTLAYHNHAFEFVPFAEGRVFDYLVENFEELHFIPDVYWLQVAGKNPAKVMESLKGRVEVCHFKDIVPDKENNFKMAPVLEGNLDFDDIIAACKKAGIQYCMVEQDLCYDLDPFDALKISFDNLSKVL